MIEPRGDVSLYFADDMSSDLYSFVFQSYMLACWARVGSCPTFSTTPLELGLQSSTVSNTQYLARRSNLPGLKKFRYYSLSLPLTSNIGISSAP